MAELLSFSNTLMSSSILFLASYILLPSRTFASSMSCLNKNKSFMKILNKTGPSVEPCGTPEKSTWKTLSASFIFKSCFLRFKYE